MAAILAVALLAAQGVNFFLLWQSRQRLEAAQEAVLASRVVTAVERYERLGKGLGRRIVSARLRRQISVTDEPQARRGVRLPRFERQLQTAFAEAGRDPQETIAAMIQFPDGAGPDRRVLLTSVAVGEDGWLNIGQPLPLEPPLEVWRLAAQTALIYAVLLGAMLIAARRLSRPLARLRAATEGDILGPEGRDLALEGPEDVRALTDAFNQMRARLQKSFAEKDMMIGAIGHDLRTPLTSLRLRVESVTDEALRNRMAGSIEELSGLLDDILALARYGTSALPPEDIDPQGLLEEVAASLGDPRILVRPAVPVVPRRICGVPSLLRRGVQNLAGNALRYAGSATLSVEGAGEGRLAFVCRDEGPGIPAAERERLMAPFERGEASRSRGTGGAGLGLAIADAAASAHGGKLVLRERTEGGLEARLEVAFAPV